MSKLISMTVTGFKSLRKVDITYAENGVTALVGPNDCGKSSILRAIEMFFDPSQRINNDELSRGFQGEATIEARFATSTASIGGDPALRSGIYSVTMHPGKDSYHIKSEPKSGGIDRPSATRADLKKFFPAFRRVSSDTLPYQVQNNDNSTLFRRILLDRFCISNPRPAIEQHEAQETARSEFSELVGKVWKSTSRSKFACLTSSGQFTPAVSGYDGRFTPLSHIGMGVQRALSLGVQIEDLRREVQKGNLFVLVDEPEESLHPRAQRDFLEFIKGIPNLQFVYATHSAAMLDISRPETIRTVLFSEEKQSTYVLERKHIHDNYETIRLVMGILPSDALTFGYVNVVVEGAIDFLVYPIWAEQLKTVGKVKTDLALLKFVNGEGSSVPHFFQVALASGLPTVAIVDNDAAGRSYRDRIHQSIERDSYSLAYEPVHFIKSDENDFDLESALPADQLVEAINTKLKLTKKITTEDLISNSKRKRSKNIEDFLKQQGVEYDEIKTEITVAVARRMTAGQIPQSVAAFFQLLAELLSKREPSVTKK